MRAQEAVVDRWRHLRAEVKAHKAAIQQHREALRIAATALRAIEHQMAARGIGLRQAGVEETHGHPDLHPRHHHSS